MNLWALIKRTIITDGFKRHNCSCALLSGELNNLIWHTLHYSNIWFMMAGPRYWCTHCLYNRCSRRPSWQTLDCHWMDNVERPQIEEPTTNLHELIKPTYCVYLAPRQWGYLSVYSGAGIHVRFWQILVQLNNICKLFLSLTNTTWSKLTTCREQKLFSDVFRFPIPHFYCYELVSAAFTKGLTSSIRFSFAHIKFYKILKE